MKQLTRKDVLEAMKESLEPLDCVYAFWEGGAAGFDRADEWSDIDAQAIVADDRVEEAFKAVDRAVKKLGGASAKFRLPEPTWHGHSQCFYKLKNASPFLLIDFAVMKEHTEADTFDAWATHGKPIVIFDKRGLIREKKIDVAEHAGAMIKRLETLKTLFEIFHVMPLKETNRGNHIEALFFYLGQTYRPLVEVLRMKHCPQRYTYATRYVYYDLPPRVVERLETFTFFPPENMEEKVAEAAEWFRETAGSVTEAGIRAKLRGKK